MFTQIYFFQFDEGGQRWHDKKLFKSRARLDIRKYSFSNRIVDKWNSLSDNSVNCKYLQKMHSNGTGTGNNKSLECDVR